MRDSEFWQGNVSSQIEVSARGKGTMQQEGFELPEDGVFQRPFGMNYKTGSIARSKRSGGLNRRKLRNSVRIKADE